MYLGYRDSVYLPFYFNGYGILSILLPGYRILCSIFVFTFRDMGYLGN